MKKATLLLLCIPGTLLVGCKKTSVNFKRYKNEVSYEEFVKQATTEIQSNDLFMLNEEDKAYSYVGKTFSYTKSKEIPMQAGIKGPKSLLKGYSESVTKFDSKNHIMLTKGSGKSSEQTPDETSKKSVEINTVVQTEGKSVLAVDKVDKSYSVLLDSDDANLYVDEIAMAAATNSVLGILGRLPKSDSFKYYVDERIYTVVEEEKADKKEGSYIIQLQIKKNSFALISELTSKGSDEDGKWNDVSVSSTVVTRKSVHLNSTNIKKFRKIEIE